MDLADELFEISTKAEQLRKRILLAHQNGTYNDRAGKVAFGKAFVDSLKEFLQHEKGYTADEVNRFILGFREYIDKNKIEDFKKVIGR